MAQDIKKIIEIFSKNLLYLRNKKGVSQQKLADLMSVSVNTIHNYESGNIPKGLHLLSLADIFGCTVDGLFSEKGTSPDPRVHVENHVSGIQNNGYAEKISLYDSGTPGYSPGSCAEPIRLVLAVLDSGDQKLIDIMTKHLQTLAEMAGGKK